MANLTFRGSASRGRQSSFDPFDVPDQTLKLQQETERTLSGMREVRSQNLQNRNEQLSAIKEKNYKESSHRAEMKSLEKTFADAVHKAEMQHYETRITDAETKTREAQRKRQQMQDLAELIPKALSTYAEFDQARRDNTFKEGKVLLNQIGGDSAKAIDFTIQAEHLKFSEAGMNTLVDKYYPNASDLQRQQLKGLRGYRLLGLRAAAGQAAIANNWDPFFSQYSKNPRNVGRSGKTLDEMLSDPELYVGTEVRALRARAEAEFQKKYFMDDNPEFVKRYFQPDLDKKADAFNAELNETLNNNRARKDRQDDIDDVDNYWALDKEGTEWVKAYVNKGGDRAHNIRTLFKVLEQKAADGSLPDDFIDKLKVTEVEINGKLTTYGESKSEYFKPVDKAIHERANRNRIIRVEEKKNYSSQAAQRMQEHIIKYGKRYNKAEWQREKDWLKSKGFSQYDMEKYAPWIKAGENREPMEIEAAKQMLDGLVTKGTLKMAHLHLVPDSLWTKYSKLASDGQHAIVDQKGIFGQLEKAIIAKASKSAKSKFEVRSEAERVISRARIKVSQLIEPALIGQFDESGKRVKGGNPTNIYQGIIDNEIRLLNSNAEGSIYERAVDKSGTTIYGPDGGFVNDHDPTSIVQGYRDAVKEKKDLSGVLTNHDKKRLVNYSNGVGRMPDFVEAMAEEDPNRDPFAMAEALTAANIKGGSIEPRGHENILRVIPPANRKLITDRGSKAKTWTAAATDPEQEDALATSFIPKDVMNKNPDNPHDVVTSSFSGNGLDLGTNVFGADLSNVPLQHIIDAQSKGIVSEVGAFKTTKNDLLRLIGTGMASPEDLFTPELQKLFYREKVYQETSTMYANYDMFEPILGIGQHWFTSAKEQKGELDADTAAALSTRLDLTKIPAAVFNEFILSQSKIKGGSAAVGVASQLTDGRIVQPLKRITK